MLRRCRGSGSEERSASGGEPLPAGPLRAVRGYARAYRPGHRSRGAVTTSDEAGNFFRSVVLQEDGTGVELMAGLDDLFRVYPPGCRIAVRLQGLAMCRRFGVVQIGTMPAAGDYAVEAIGVRALLDRYVACETVDVLRPVPRIVAFDELAPDMCGCLVQIEDLTPLPSEEDPTDWKWEGYRLFEDRAGNRIATYTSTYARYAASEIPKGPVTLVGVFAVRQCRVDRKILYD